MRHLLKLLPALALAFALIARTTPAQAAPRAEPVSSSSANDTARYLAGLPPSGGVAEQLSRTPEWQQHAAFMQQAWGRFDLTKLSKLREWAGSELDVRGAIFYPFSGPDFVYAFNFFPRSGTYILAALEPVGTVPPVEEIPVEALLGVESSLQTLLKAGYFVTKDMRANLRGTLPILYIMLARSGCTIHDVKMLPNGAQIQFGTGTGDRRTLFYISCDLSNGGFRGNRGLQSLVKEAGARTALIKADSYLLHTNDFSDVRDMLLNQMRVIVQDDSGIPLRHFDPAKWNLRLYGTYTPPLDIFAQYYQPEMAAAFAQGARPLPFGLGYKWNPKEASVIVAARK